MSELSEMRSLCLTVDHEIFCNGTGDVVNFERYLKAVADDPGLGAIALGKSAEASSDTCAEICSTEMDRNV